MILSELLLFYPTKTALKLPEEEKDQNSTQTTLFLSRRGNYFQDADK